MHILILSLFALVAGCGSSSSETGGETTFADSNDPAYAASFDGTVDERISTSTGEEGGYVLLWPRIVPASDAQDPVASQVQDRLRAILERRRGSRPLDVRPSPQRACPQSGCQGLAVGALLLHSGGGCAVVLTIAQPGRSATRLVPWAGGVQLSATMVPFREPPESSVRVTDFARCDDLDPAMTAGEPGVEGALGEEVRD